MTNKAGKPFDGYLKKKREIVTWIVRRSRLCRSRVPAFSGLRSAAALVQESGDPILPAPLVETPHVPQVHLVCVRYHRDSLWKQAHGLAQPREIALQRNFAPAT